MSSSSSEQEKKEGQLQKAVLTLLAFVGVVLVFFIASVIVAVSYNKWKNLGWFLNGDQKFTLKALALGTAASIVFGFFDNAGMFFGIDALKPYLPDGELTRAGWGNIVSSVLGAFLASFVGKMIANTTGFTNGPVYADALGIFIGGVLGIYIPRLITGKK